jgi:hypothetical protein
MPTMDVSNNDLVVEIVGTLNLRFKHLNPSVYYEAGWDDSMCLVSCQHRHRTPLEASNCGMTKPAGRFVFAVENGKMRHLRQDEDDAVNGFRPKLATAYQKAVRVLGGT